MTMFLPDMNTQAQTASGTKVLVAYFSHSGNTRAMARQIAEATGGDLFEIVPAAAYPAEYGAVVDQAKKEIGGGVRPALKGRLPDVGAYDVIFVGSPCWGPRSRRRWRRSSRTATGRARPSCRL